MSPSVAGEGEADDADPEDPLTRSADDEDRLARTAGCAGFTLLRHRMLLA
jgi:hypothetical protein